MTEDVKRIEVETSRVAYIISANKARIIYYRNWCILAHMGGVLIELIEDKEEVCEYVSGSFSGA